MKKSIAIAVLLFVPVIFAQDKTISGTTSNIMTITPPEPQPTILIGGSQIIDITDKEGKPVVHIDQAGKVTYGYGYKPEEGARMFWQELEKYYPEMCTNLAPTLKNK